jgi:hypothetical protein
MPPIKKPKNPGSYNVRFHFHSIRFTPYSEQKKSSTDVLLELVAYISQEKSLGRAVLLTRYENGAPEDHREMFIDYVALTGPEKKIKFSIALFRKNNTPWVKPEDSIDLVPLNEINGSLVERTHFFIDYSREPAIVCVQYNHYGARFTDILFYLRFLSKNKLKISHGLLTQAFIDKPFEDTLTAMENVLRLELKMKPEYITYLDPKVKHYYTGMVTLQNSLKPRILEFKAFYQTPGAKSTPLLKNIEANGFFKNMLNVFSKNSEQEDLFEHFEVDYKDKLGEDITFNLFKDKSGFDKEIDFKIASTTTKVYNLILEDFNEFLSFRFNVR